MREKAIRILALIIALFLASCGGDKPSEQFSSVVVNMSIDPTSVDADVAFWVNTDRDENNTCDEYTINSTRINLNVSVEPLPGVDTQTVSPSPVSIESVEIEYIPTVTTAPSISKAYRLLGNTIVPGSPVTVPIEILSQDQKVNLIGITGGAILRPSPQIYSYNVILRFRVREIYSGDVQTIERGLFMKVSDFISDGENCSL